MAKFASNYTFRDPLRTIEFKRGQSTADAQVIEAAQAAGALAEEKTNASNGPTKGSKASRTLHLKG